MKFKIIIDEEKEEEIIATVHKPTPLLDEIEALLANYTSSDRILAYQEDTVKMLRFSEISCATVLNGKTYLIDTKNRQYTVRHRLYELEKTFPSYFIRINKSALANEKQLDRFSVTYSGGVDAIFKCGYSDYVSRRCFAQIKRRYENK